MPLLEAIGETNSLKSYVGPDRVVSSVAFAQRLAALPPVPHFQTGLTLLDQACGGFEGGELIVISGPTAMGKTLLCDTIVQNLNLQNKRSLFFTFEVTPQKMIENHLQPSNAVYLPLEHKASDLRWLRDRVQEGIEKYEICAVFIDHLHYIVDMATPHNMSLEIGSVMRFLKRDLALAYNLPIFVVCHSAKIPFEQEPSMRHLRDSSFTAQEADLVWIVFRRFDKDFSGKPLTTMLQGLATLKVEKARRTGCMGAKIEVYKQGNKLAEASNGN